MERQQRGKHAHGFSFFSFLPTFFSFFIVRAVLYPPPRACGKDGARWRGGVSIRRQLRLEAIAALLDPSDAAACAAAGGTWTFRPENFIRVEFDVEFTKNEPQTLKGHGFSTADVPAMRVDGRKLRNVDADGNAADASLLISAKEGICPWCCINAASGDAGSYATEAACLSPETVRDHNGLASSGICTMKYPDSATAGDKAVAATITVENGAQGDCEYGNQGINRQWTSYTWEDRGPPARTGTKENLECSNKGTCDGSTGTCHCYLGFGSSDGKGSNGMRMDCGWKRDVVVSPA